MSSPQHEVLMHDLSLPARTHGERMTVAEPVTMYLPNAFLAGFACLGICDDVTVFVRFRPGVTVVSSWPRR
jgi:hypothetical protein